MRENCTSGLEGGGAEPNRPSLPLSNYDTPESVAGFGAANQPRGRAVVTPFEPASLRDDRGGLGKTVLPRPLPQAGQSAVLVTQFERGGGRFAPLGDDAPGAGGEEGAEARRGTDGELGL